MSAHAVYIICSHALDFELYKTAIHAAQSWCIITYSTKQSIMLQSSISTWVPPHDILYTVISTQYLRTVVLSFLTITDTH